MINDARERVRTKLDSQWETSTSFVVTALVQLAIGDFIVDSGELDVTINVIACEVTSIDPSTYDEIDYWL